jgi:hypothetical protein
MIRTTRFGAVALSVVATASCQQLSNPPLIFGQTHTVGITIAGSPAEQGGELTLGYRDRDLALVPVSVPQGDGVSTQLESHVFGNHRSAADQPDKDAFSVLGQFDVSTEGREAKVGLGKFFATGLAARRLADGFACALSDGNEKQCLREQDDDGNGS